MNTKSILQTSNLLRILYPIWMIVGILGLVYIPSQLSSDNPSETIAAIQSQELLFRFGILFRLLAQIFSFVFPILLYLLFRNSNEDVSKLMAILAFLGVPIAMGSEIFNLQALGLLDQPELADRFLSLAWEGTNLATFFWGFWLFPLGYLAVKSKFFPSWISIVLYLAGLGYVLGAVIKILMPESKLFIQIAEVLTVGEVVFILWFVIMGIRKSNLVSSS